MGRGREKGDLDLESEENDGGEKMVLTDSKKSYQTNGTTCTFLLLLFY